MKRLGLTEIKSYVLSHTGNKGQKKKKKKKEHTLENKYGLKEIILGSGFLEAFIWSPER